PGSWPAIKQSMEQPMNHQDRAATPDISILICTRDRSDSLLPTVRSILEDAPMDGSAEVLVIDQGRGDAVEQALAPLLVSDTRLRYLREASVGLSAARNAGLRVARGAVIAFTDDDCTVEPGWLGALQAAFAAHPEAGILFGHVACAEHDP